MFQLIKDLLGITLLEERMASFDEQLANLDQVTNEIADLVESLQTALENADEVSDARLQDAADALGARVDTLRALGADPTDPVPTPEV